MCQHEQDFSFRGVVKGMRGEEATVRHVRELDNFCRAVTKIAAGILWPIELHFCHLPNAQRLVGYDGLLGIQAKIDM